MNRKTQNNCLVRGFPIYLPIILLIRKSESRSTVDLIVKYTIDRYYFQNTMHVKFMRRFTNCAIKNLYNYQKTRNLTFQCILGSCFPKIQPVFLLVYHEHNLLNGNT